MFNEKRKAHSGLYLIAKPVNESGTRMNQFFTLGGRIQCTQCTAMSKRTKQQCRAPAIKGKTKCKFHGGRSTGPKTEAGRKRCGEVHLIHGQETRALRAERRIKTAELQELEAAFRLHVPAPQNAPG